MIAFLVLRKTSSVTVDGHTALSVLKSEANVLVIRHSLLGELVSLVEASSVACLCLSRKLLPSLASLENTQMPLPGPALPFIVMELKMKQSECARDPLISLR